MALQDFGFYVMGQAVLLLGIVIGGTFLVSAIFGAIPSPFAPATAVLSQTSTLVAPIFAMFFAALAAAGFGFGIYIPMIPLIVWISAILGWIGHSFQAIVGAPLVALRMTTAEGEGLLGGATEGVMMLLGVLLTPFLLVLGFVANLIILKQVLIVVNYLFSLFVSYSFGPRSGGLSMQSIAWAMIGAPAILLVYFTLITGVVQALATKLIGEFPGEILRHLHNSMTGHRAAERMEGKMEGASDRGAGQAGELGGKGANLGAAQQAMMKPHEDRANAKANANKPKPNDDK
jgi:conjugal transfer/type IV secretion protein DotA/TraY